ncbi:MAG: hypothetical protein AAGF45_04780 [Pseudomonadota bacterium]
MRDQRGGKRPLSRKVNTKARGVWHNSGDHYRWTRNSKDVETNPRAGRMKRGKERGLDYTPLYRFLLSKVGEDFAAVHSEAVSRLDKEEPIWHLVARNEEGRRDIVGIGESTFWSGLYVDDENRLAVVDPSIGIEELNPLCACCTHTFNGVPFVRAHVFGAPLRGEGR